MTVKTAQNQAGKLSAAGYTPHVVTVASQHHRYYITAKPKGSNTPLSLDSLPEVLAYLNGNAAAVVDYERYLTDMHKEPRLTAKAVAAHFAAVRQVDAGASFMELPPAAGQAIVTIDPKGGSPARYFRSAAEVTGFIKGVFTAPAYTPDVVKLPPPVPVDPTKL